MQKHTKKVAANANSDVQAIPINFTVLSDLPSSVQDLADLLVELALKQQVREKQLKLVGEYHHD
jgi:hypothetical protein